MTTAISPAITTALNTYYQNVRTHLACPKKEADRLIAQSRRLAEDFILNHPGLDFSDVVGFLGPPKDLANSFLEIMDPKLVAAYAKKQRRKRYLRKILLVACLVLVSYYIYCSVSFRAHPQITQEITTVIYEDSNDTVIPNSANQPNG